MMGTLSAPASAGEPRAFANLSRSRTRPPKPPTDLSVWVRRLEDIAELAEQIRSWVEPLIPFLFRHRAGRLSSPG